MLHLIGIILIGSFKQAFTALVELNRGFLLIALIAICYKAFGLPGAIISFVQSFIVNGLWLFLNYHKLKNNIAETIEQTIHNELAKRKDGD